MWDENSLYEDMLDKEDTLKEFGNEEEDMTKISFLVKRFPVSSIDIARKRNEFLLFLLF